MTRLRARLTRVEHLLPADPDRQSGAGLWDRPDPRAIAAVADWLTGDGLTVEALLAVNRRHEHGMPRKTAVQAQAELEAARALAADLRGGHGPTETWHDLMVSLPYDVFQLFDEWCDSEERLEAAH